MSSALRNMIISSNEQKEKDQTTRPEQIREASNKYFKF
jgi:hypothetical protein